MRLLRLARACRAVAGLLAVALLTFAPVLACAKTLRLFAVGNSFSNNATTYLKPITESAGDELIFGTAQTGGCSLARHWNAAAAELAMPGSADAKIYGGKSLVEIINRGTWDVITIQQYSLHSSDIETYRPYAQQLYDHLRKLQPEAEIVVHQTWAYRSDANRFGQIAPDQHATTNRQMWEKSRAAYRQIAAELNTRLLPVGDAFWRVDSDPQWAFLPDASFDSQSAVFPNLPKQTHSLHVGYRWTTEKKLSKDANHANVAGQYLGGLVWYGCLYQQPPTKVTFVPNGLDAEFAAHLRRVAAQVVEEAATSQPSKSIAK